MCENAGNEDMKEGTWLRIQSLSKKKRTHKRRTIRNRKIEPKEEEESLSKTSGMIRKRRKSAQSCVHLSLSPTSFIANLFLRFMDIVV